ncbi:ATP/GTP-binding protein [Geoglobus ahangari]
MNIILLGPAGSGKSAIAESFSKYLEDKGYSAGVVNLDSASPPRYSPISDVREFVRAEEVMEKEGLGINGALLRSMELAAEHLDDLIPKDGWDFVIYDTPGQLELFMYTSFGRELVSRLESFTVGIFLADSTRVTSPSTYSAMIAQSAIVTLMLEIPSITAFNKSDRARVKEFEHYARELEGEGVLGEFFEKLLKFVEATSVIYRPVLVSAKTGEGFDELFSAVNEVFCACGDLS